MKVIGITGGVGSGKSALLAYIGGHYNCKILLADEAAHRVKEPGKPCYEKLTALLSKEILHKDGTIDKGRMAAKIFSDEKLLAKVNAIIHPAVKELIVDEMWYIYADKKKKKKRLLSSRGYSEEKIDSIMATQLSEEEFRKYCKVVIDNNGSLLEAYGQIDQELEEGMKEK